MLLTCACDRMVIHTHVMKASICIPSCVTSPLLADASLVLHKVHSTVDTAAALLGRRTRRANMMYYNKGVPDVLSSCNLSKAACHPHIEADDQCSRICHYCFCQLAAAMCSAENIIHRTCLLECVVDPACWSQASVASSKMLGATLSGYAAASRQHA